MSQGADKLPAIEVRGLSKTYPADEGFLSLARRRLSKGEAPPGRPALVDVDFNLRPGEALGVIGENGSGKSTLLRILLGIAAPTGGEAVVRGRVAALLELGVGFDPEFSGRENVLLYGALLGIGARAMRERLPKIIAFADIGDYLDRPVRTYSAGMRVRLAFATAVHVNPDILFIDEVLAVGDSAFQKKCHGRIRKMREAGASIVFVSHDMNAVAGLADRVLMLDRGRVFALGSPKTVVALYEKFLFAPETRRAAMREEARKPGFDPEKAMAFPDTGERRPVVYESRGAEIQNPRVLDESGRAVNTLLPGKTYTYRYEVRFLEDAEAVRFGMMITNRQGLMLGGRVSHAEDRGLERVRAGTVHSQEFEFQCRMAPDVYFFNAGVSARDRDREIYLHRVVDALTVKVHAVKDTRVTGMVDLAPEPEGHGEENE